MDTWDKGLIYCSDMTAKLIAHKLGVDQKYLCALPMDIPQNVDGNLGGSEGNLPYINIVPTQFA